MISLKKQKDNWNQYLRGRRYRLSVFGLKQETDWHLLFLVFIIATVFVGLSNFKIYNRILEVGEQKFDINSKKTEIIDLKEVDEKILFFKKQKIMLDRLLSEVNSE